MQVSAVALQRVHVCNEVHPSDPKLDILKVSLTWSGHATLGLEPEYGRWEWVEYSH